ncbi:MAG: poly(3-hydroxybutyrate) depolymerase, partial [Alphaproteobacteria bacterium]|nr:poly(3-hydroxybutyrate) depolymerase [Alphaproteobacteria bacterium]
MAIGEFGGAPAALGPSGPMYAAPAYWFYEMSQAALNPSRAFADAARLFYRNPANPLSYTSFGKSMAAGLELFERSTRRYGKPEWNITSTVVGGQHVPVHVASVWERP